MTIGLNNGSAFRDGEIWAVANQRLQLYPEHDFLFLFKKTNYPKKPKKKS